MVKPLNPIHKPFPIVQMVCWRLGLPYKFVWWIQLPGGSYSRTRTCWRVCGADFWTLGYDGRRENIAMGSCDHFIPADVVFTPARFNQQITIMYCHVLFFHRYQIVSFKDPQIILDPYICRSLPTKDPLCLGRRQPCGTEKLHFGGVSDEKGICYSLLFFAELHCYQLL